jgi:hypothetical protein
MAKMTAAQLESFNKLIVDILGNSEERAQAVFDSGIVADALRANLAATTRSHWRPAMGLAPNPNHVTMSRAKEILGADMITPFDVHRIFHKTSHPLTEAEIAIFAQSVPFDEKTLWKCREEQYMLIPGRPLTPRTLIELFPENFLYNDDLLQEQAPRFFTESHPEPRWYLIRSGDVAEMRNRRLDEQVGLNSRDTSLCRASVVLYCSLIVQKVRNFFITPGTFIRCPDRVNASDSVVIRQDAPNQHIHISLRNVDEMHPQLSVTVEHRPQPD